MKSVAATWKNGQIHPDEPVDWPEGCRLSVEPVEDGDCIGMREEEWSNSPEAIADWLRWYESLEPLEFTTMEEEGMASWRQKLKEHTISKVDRRVEGLFE